MVEIEELKQILHDEKMAEIRAKTKVMQKEIKKQEAEDRELFKLREHWTGQKATLADVSNDINPKGQKIFTLWDEGINRLQAHQMGIMHGFYLRLSVVALLAFVYVYL